MDQGRKPRVHSVDRRHTHGHEAVRHGERSNGCLDQRARAASFGPNEVAFVDNRYKSLHGMDAAPYLDAIRDWVKNGDKSAFVLSEEEVKNESRRRVRIAYSPMPNSTLRSISTRTANAGDAIPHFKEAQRLDPDNWNYKRQAWALSDAERDYGTNWNKEVQKMTQAGKRTPICTLPEVKKDH